MTFSMAEVDCGASQSRPTTTAIATRIRPQHGPPLLRTPGVPVADGHGSTPTAFPGRRYKPRAPGMKGRLSRPENLQRQSKLAACGIYCAELVDQRRDLGILALRALGEALAPRRRGRAASRFWLILTLASSRVMASLKPTMPRAMRPDSSPAHRSSPRAPHRAPPAGRVSSETCASSQAGSSTASSRP